MTKTTEDVIDELMIYVRKMKEHGKHKKYTTDEHYYGQMYAYSNVVEVLNLLKEELKK